MNSLTGSLFLIKLCVWHCGSDAGICSEKESAHHLSSGQEWLLWRPLRIWTSFTESLNSTKLLMKKYFRLLLRRLGCPQDVEAEDSKVERKEEGGPLSSGILSSGISAPQWDETLNHTELDIFQTRNLGSFTNDIRPKLQSYRQSLSLYKGISYWITVFAQYLKIEF